MATRAATWQRNALFRVLAFLDNTGTQPFELAAEVAMDGSFVQPARVFAAGKPVRGVLDAGLLALRSNVMRLFSDPAERQALLRIIGDDDAVPATVAALEKSPATASNNTSEGTVRCSAGRADALASASVKSTPWAEAVRCPASLREFADTLEGGFSINLFCRLQEVLAVPLDLATTATESPLTEQFFIDALDRYVTELPAAELDRMVLACGVQPPVLAAVRAGEGGDNATAGSDGVDTLSDFVIDVVFPTVASMSATSSESTQESEGGGTVLDWLLLSYEKNHESISVDDGEVCSVGDEDDEAGEGGRDASPQKRARREPAVATPPVLEDTGLKGWTPDHGELVLIADNLDEFMQHHPRLIPREILRERRRAWTDPAITRFELANHYTTAELRAAVRQLALLPSASTESRAELERQLGHTVGDELIRDAGKATRKEQYLDLILRCHSS